MEDLAATGAKAGEMLEPLGIASEYHELRALIAARRKQLGLSQLALDELAGVPSGYSGKIEAGIRHFGDVSLGCVLGALSLSLALIPSAGRHKEKQDEIKALNSALSGRMKKLGCRGGLAARKRMTDAEWAIHCRRAAKIRWRKWRDLKVEKAARARRAKRRAAQSSSDLK